MRDLCQSDNPLNVLPTSHKTGYVRMCSTGTEFEIQAQKLFKDIYAQLLQGQLAATGAEKDRQQVRDLCMREACTGLVQP